jgi:catechol 2,3-dioxygenase-like lactoylglutathione lyase family enzyme
VALGNRLTFHHTGVVVKSMKEARAQYVRMFGAAAVSEVIAVSSQGVEVCFVQVSPHACLELVASTDPNGKIARMAAKGASYYHTGYLTADIEATVAELLTLDCRAAGDYFCSEAFGGRRCIFLFTPQAHLVELIEEL